MNYSLTKLVITEVPDIKKVIFNDPATIIYWSDGTKTVVKTCEGDTFDNQTGLLMCIAKRFLGKEKFHKVLKNYLENYN